MLVANLADVLGFASPALAGDLNAFGAYPERAPLFFGVWFVVVLAWLVPWRRALLRRPALVTSLVGLLVTLLLTQAPSALGPLRWPIRFVPGVPLFLGVGTAAAVAAGGLVLTRGRVAGALLGVLATGVLSVFRLPTSLDPVVGSVLLAAAAGVLLLAAARAGSRFAGAAALAGTLVLVAWTATVHAADGMANRGIPSTPRPGRLVLDQRPTLLLFTRNSPPRAFAEGVTSGFARLGADQRTQPGYSSIGQKGWDQRFCVGAAHSNTCPAAVQRLFEVEPRTGLPWVDLLGYRDVVVEQGRPLARMQRITRATGGWEETGRSRDYVRFSRVTPPGTTGRVTAVLGQASVTALDVARSSQGYRVRSARGATLVFRDLYWPGYVATLDGAPLAVGRLSDTLVTVDVPAGADGRLTLEYVAMPPTMWMPPVGAGVVGIGLAVVLARPGRPLRRPGSGGRAGGAEMRASEAGGRGGLPPVASGGMRPTSTSVGLAPVLAAALVRGGTDATPAEIDEVARSVTRSVDAMPDTLRLGVRAAELAADVVLRALGRGSFRAQSSARQAELAARLATLPLPAVPELVRLAGAWAWRPSTRPDRRSPAPVRSPPDEPVVRRGGGRLGPRRLGDGPRARTCRPARPDRRGGAVGRAR